MKKKKVFSVFILLIFSMLLIVGCVGGVNFVIDKLSVVSLSIVVFSLVEVVKE